MDIDAWLENKTLTYETFLAVHNYIFGDLYEWAGKIRTIPIYKEEVVLGGISLNYGDVSSIQSQAELIIDELNQIEWFEISVEDIIPLFVDLIALILLEKEIPAQ